MTAAELTPGTLVYNCYRIQNILGQGGCGRTYLVTNEQGEPKLCVLKEFVPNDSNQAYKVKCLELFQREAETLRKLNHPQIPEFLDFIEENGRLFVVQEYVNGKNYSILLQDKQCFSEAEVIRFLQTLLPVLDYIHGQKIFHRDISPDNIMLPNGSDQPILIDFGVAKQISTQVYALSATSVGKIGYAPPEQIHGGQCFASSDLYALAVTSIVLLTGKEVNLLFDSHNLEWHWRRYANVSEELAGILNKMLAYKPKARYQSVTEVKVAMQSLVRTRPAKTIISGPNSGVTQLLAPTRPIRLPILVTITTLVLLTGVGVAVNANLCHVLNNCINNNEYDATYSAAVQQATAAQNFAQSAKSISELQDSRQRLQNAINQLQTIPQNAKVYPQVAQALVDNKNQLTGIDTRLQNETKAQQILDEAEKIAADATIKTDAAGNSIPQLKEARAIWEKAQKKAHEVPENSTVGKLALQRSQDYQQKTRNIASLIDKMDAALTQKTEPQAGQLRQSQSSRITKNSSDDSPPPSRSHRTSSDDSPPPSRSHRTSSDDSPPPSRSHRTSSDDSPPPSRQHRISSDDSPPPSRQHRISSDDSPPPSRRRQSGGESSSSPLWGSDSKDSGSSSSPLF